MSNENDLTTNNTPGHQYGLSERLRVSTSVNKPDLAKAVLQWITTYPESHNQATWWQRNEDTPDVYQWPTISDLLGGHQQPNCGTVMCVAGHIVVAALSADPEVKLAMTYDGKRVILPQSAAGLIRNNPQHSSELGLPWVFRHEVPRCALFAWLTNVAEGVDADVADRRVESDHGQCKPYTMAHETNSAGLQPMHDVCFQKGA